MHDCLFFVSFQNLMWDIGFTFYCLEMLRLILFRTRDYLLWNGLLIILGQLWTSLIMQPPYSPQFQHIFYTTTNPFFLRMSFNFIFHAKLYTPSTLNIDLILWHTQFIKCAENVKSWVFPLTFQAYILPHTLNCICVNLFKFHIWILEQF